jgi:hypothetical protein
MRDSVQRDTRWKRFFFPPRIKQAGFDRRSNQKGAVCRRERRWLFLRRWGYSSESFCVRIRTDRAASLDFLRVVDAPLVAKTEIEPVLMIPSNWRNSCVLLPSREIEA